MSTAKPNILFIINHDLSRRYGCYGNAAAITPNIDRLAGQGMLFERHYCNYALCGPSRANIFTGCRPETTERYDNHEFFHPFRERMGRDYAALPEHFRRHGYFTQSLGQVLHGRDVDEPSWSVPQWWTECGVPDWAPGAKGQWFAHWINPESLALQRERYERLVAEGKDPCEGDNYKRWRGPAVEIGECSNGRYAQEGVTDRAVESIGRLTREGRPFFLGVGYELGHTPWYAPREYWELYDPRQLPDPLPQGPPSGAPTLAFGGNEPGQFYTQDYYDKPFMPDEEQSRELLHGAYASMSYFDAQVGRLLDSLAASGSWSNTLVLLTSDHGISWGEHGKWGKHNLWEQSLSVPLVIGGAGRGAGASTRALTEHVDIYPTLCDLCGLPTPAFVEGTSMAPLFDDPARPWKEAVFAMISGGRGVRTDRYRYNEYPGGPGGTVEVELYDYESDPLQSRNLAVDPACQDVCERMRAVLGNGWRARVPV